MNISAGKFLRTLQENPHFVIHGFDLIGFGSWRGDYGEPCIFVCKVEQGCIFASSLINVIEKLTDGTVYHGYKGGEYTFTLDQCLHFELDESSCSYGLCDLLVAANSVELMECLLRDLSE